jgi:hypothetical protein
MTPVQFSALIAGLDWRRVHEARETSAPTGVDSRQNEPASIVALQRRM